jgi:outer membrane protein W
VRKIGYALLVVAFGASVAAAGNKKKKKAPPPPPPPPVEEPAPPPEPEIEVKPKEEPVSPDVAPAPVQVDHGHLGADDGARKRPPGFSIHRLYFRAGVANVAPHTDSREMELSNIDGPASLALQNGPIAGSGADIGSMTIPAAIVGYTLPFARDRFSLETILGTPLDVKFTATGTLANQSLAPTALGIPTGVMPLGPEVGSAKGVPPVVTLTYAFLDRGKTVVPFIGAGASVLFAVNPKITNPILAEVSTPKMKVSPAAGFVVQGGVDVKVWKRIRARLDVKYIAGMLAKAEVDHMVVKTPGIPLFDTVEVGTAKMAVWVNPTIVTLGLGYDF